jgi:hypothetical protein
MVTSRGTPLAALVGGLAACAMIAGLSAFAGPGGRTTMTALDAYSARHMGTAPNRPLPGPLYGVTADDLSGTARLAAGLRNLPEAPTTRLYFDTREPAGYYAAAVTALRPVSYLMGELLDSSDEAGITAPAYRARVKSYLAAFGNKVDVWEIGNEVNGNWAGSYPTVAAKLTGAYSDVAAAGKRSALTLYYNVGCGDGPAELDPLAFSRSYVPAAVRDGLGYVLLSYYEGDCRGLRPSAATWTAYFRHLHVLYPHALLGFGEVGLSHPATAKTQAAAMSMIRYYYGLSIKLRYFVGGYFWWYFTEDGLPYASKPLSAVLGDGLRAEAKAWSQHPAAQAVVGVTAVTPHTPAG